MLDLTDEWWTPTTMEEKIGFSRSRQARLRMERKIPYVKIGAYVRYSKKAIYEWLDNAKVV